MQYQTISIENKLLVKCYSRTSKQIYLKMSCENGIWMHFCIQEKSKSDSFKGTKAGTNGTHPWKVNMCFALFEEIWLQNNKVIDFSKHASWFAQQVFLNFRSKHQDVMFWIFTFSIFESSHLLVFECVITLRTTLFWITVTKGKAIGDLIVYYKSGFCFQSENERI